MRRLAQNGMIVCLNASFLDSKLWDTALPIFAEQKMRISSIYVSNIHYYIPVQSKGTFFNTLNRVADPQSIVIYADKAGKNSAFPGNLEQLIFFKGVPKSLQETTTFGACTTSTSPKIPPNRKSAAAKAFKSLCSLLLLSLNPRVQGDQLRNNFADNINTVVNVFPRRETAQREAHRRAS